jgi:hypothetical protein
MVSGRGGRFGLQHGQVDPKPPDLLVRDHVFFE